MHRLHFAVAHLKAGCRSHASYGVTPLSHVNMKERFTVVDNATSELELLELAEQRISTWKLNKWQFRIPPLLSLDKRETLLLQRDILKGLCLDRARQLDSIGHDLELVATLANISPDTVRDKNRSWLQEEMGKLRWRGEVNKAKELRDAFLRLEVCGSRDYQLLQRLCCIYGLGMLGTFEEAFSDTIVVDSVSKKLSVDERNPFIDLLSRIVSNYPHIDIIYDFLGFNPSAGYRDSLGHFLSEILSHRCDKKSTPSGRVLFSNQTTKEVLFDVGDSSKSITSNDSVYGLPDFLYSRGSDLFLITIASSNHWLRNRQIPHAKQLEGIGRRWSFVLGAPFDSVRIKNVLLPPQYLDKNSLNRILDIVLEISPEEQRKFAPWLSVYDKELDERDVDFAELTKTVNEEEWLTL